MKVLEFDTNKGIYQFNLEDFETTLHQHPVVEIIVAQKGSFNIITKDRIYQNLSFGAIDANVKHGITMTDCTVILYMIEYHNSMTKLMLNNQNLNFDAGIWFEDNPLKIAPITLEIEKQLQNLTTNRSHYDHRIAAVIDYINHNELDYYSMLDTLVGVANLSESRLSHLFKQEIGLSLKKYLVWSKLKQTIQSHLSDSKDLFSALIESGFYDHPHFSNSFKTMLGINPSKVYNSRTLQVITKPNP